MSAFNYSIPTARSSVRLERLILALGICLPVPLLAVTGMSLPMPSVVERIAAALVPWGDATPATHQIGVAEKGSIVLAPGEPAQERPADAGPAPASTRARAPRTDGSNARRAETPSAQSPLGGALPRDRGGSTASPPAAGITPATPSTPARPRVDSPAATVETTARTATVAGPITVTLPQTPIPTGPAPSPVQETVDPVTKTVEPVIEQTVDTVTHPVEPVTKAVEPVIKVAEPITKTVPPVTNTVDAAVGALPKPVGGLVPRLGG